jgi:hypothetical protein
MWVDGWTEEWIIIEKRIPYIGKGLIVQCALASAVLIAEPKDTW